MHFLKREIRIPKISLLKSKKKEEILPCYRHINRGALVEELITTFGARRRIPIHYFSAQEILSATNNFGQSLDDFGGLYGSMYLGNLERRPILVKKYTGNDSNSVKFNIRDIAVNSQLNHHRNVLKLVGCCLDFECPALVYDFSGTEGLADRLFGSSGSPLSWRSRLRIANDVASVIADLHEAFPTPIIFRDINPRNVMIDEHGVAKLFDFSICISLPPGEEEVEDRVCGTIGYLDPSYLATGVVTQKTDVYCFGNLLLNILTGRKAIDFNDEEFPNLVDRVIDHIGKDELEEIVDPKLLVEGRGAQKKQQIHAFLHLALSCSVRKVEDRPFMVDVVKQLCKIERYPGQLPSLESIWSSIKSLSRDLLEQPVLVSDSDFSEQPVLVSDSDSDSDYGR